MLQCELCEYKPSDEEYCNLGSILDAAAGTCDHYSSSKVFRSLEGMEYSFKRDFYVNLKENTQKYFATALLGPRKCGKTVALTQLNRELPNSKYYDAKNMSPCEHVQLLQDILTSIQTNADVVYLVDEITYIDCADTFIETLAVESRRYQCPNTHVVFTGSQSLALRSWIDRSFGGCAGYVRVDFMNYAEWLRYMSKSAPTEENYIEFLSSIDKFYRLSNLEDYLRACLEETVISNSHSMNVIFNNEVEGLSEQFLIDILFSTLVSLHNQVSYSKFTSRDSLFNTIKYNYGSKLLDLAIVKERVDKVVTRYYNTFKSAAIDDIINALIFLASCGLIRIFEVSDSPSFKDYTTELCSLSSGERKQKVFNKQTLFSRLNITIVHPMFYIALLKQALDINSITELPGSLLGSIVECHCRGLLRRREAYEFHTVVAEGSDFSEKEIDFVDPNDHLAVEFTVSNEHSECFDLLNDGEDYYCIRLSHNLNTSWKTQKGQFVRCVPYYEFIYHLAIGRDPKKV